MIDSNVEWMKINRKRGILIGVLRGSGPSGLRNIRLMLLSKVRPLIRKVLFTFKSDIFCAAVFRDGASRVNQIQARSLMSSCLILCLEVIIFEILDFFFV